MRYEITLDNRGAPCYRGCRLLQTIKGEWIVDVNFEVNWEYGTEVTLKLFKDYCSAYSAIELSKKIDLILDGNSINFIKE